MTKFIYDRSARKWIELTNDEYNERKGIEKTSVYEYVDNSVHCPICNKFLTTLNIKHINICREPKEIYFCSQSCKRKFSESINLVEIIPSEIISNP